MADVVVARACETLALIETEEAGKTRLPVPVIKSVRRKLTLLRAAPDDRALRKGTASAHGVDNYAFFQNAGYRGMYNMDLSQVRAKKGVPNGRSPLDFMGKTELAANLFRITQTDAKIRNDDVRGQKPLERTAEQVGKKVRDTMISLSGTRPEALPPAADIKKVQTGLKCLPAFTASHGCGIGLALGVYFVG